MLTHPHSQRRNPAHSYRARPVEDSNVFPGRGHFVSVLKLHVRSDDCRGVGGGSTTGPRLNNMSLLKQRGRELERFDGLSLIYWYVKSLDSIPARALTVGNRMDENDDIW